MAGFLLFLLFYGAWITGVVFREPDICWLLAGGRWIVEHGQIPATDPFSYTSHYQSAPYVVEQWLSELVFYGVYANSGCLGLLVLDSLVLAFTFVVMPFRILYRCGGRGWSAVAWVFLVCLGSFCHLCVRPEIFSFLFTAVLLELLIYVSDKVEKTGKIGWNAVVLTGVMAMLWCSLHTLFFLAAVLPALYSGCVLIERFLLGRKDRPLNLTAPLMAVAALLGTLINPYGLEIWLYLPVVFGPCNNTINEMQPLSLKNVATPFFYPFYVLSIISVVTLVKQWKQPLAKNGLFFRLLIPLGIGGPFKAVRGIPLALLLLITGDARLGARDQPESLSKGSQIVDRLTRRMGFKWYGLCLLTTVLGCVMLTGAVPPDIPQSSAAFTVPLQAIDYLEKHAPPSGNLLNDPHFGAVMQWKMHPNPPLFIDPRYYLFGDNLVPEYWRMVSCVGDWQQLLERYKISWVFVPADLELSKRLRTDQAWNLLYSDQHSVIFARKEPIAGGIHK